MKKYKIFISICVLVVLVIPLCHINPDKTSKQENRDLAVFPSISKEGKLNYDYGKEFEAWLGDRFWGREALIGAGFQTIYKINGKIENKQALMSPDGMIFDKDRIKSICTPINKEEFNKIKSSLKSLKTWCNSHNIKLYIFISPDKEDVFLDQFADLLQKCERDSVSNFISRIKRELDIDILYNKDIYKENHKEFTFAHTDHHWTEYGALLTYQELSKRIKKDFPDFTILSKSDFNVFYNTYPRSGNFDNLFERPFYNGSNCATLGLFNKNCPLTHRYAYYDHKKLKHLNVEHGPIGWSRLTNFLDSENNLNVTLLGESHGGFLMSFLPYSVRNVFMIRTNNFENNVENIYDMKRFEKLILDFKTDILLIYFSSSTLKHFSNFYD